MTRAIARLARRRESQALVISEALHRGLVDALEGCMICVDADGTIGFANRYATELLASDGTRLEGQSLLALLDTSGQLRIARALRGVANGESVRDVDTRHELADRTCTIRWSVTPLRDAGVSRWAALALGIDVTGWLEGEHQNVEDEAMSVMGTLTMGLAHELRNPLNAAKLQLELLLLRAKRVGDERVQHQLAEPATLVRTALGRMSSLFDEFLHVARPREPVRTAHSVAELFDHVLTLQQPLVAHTGIALRRFVQQEDLMARCDEAKIQQVLINLIRNSCDALQIRGDGHVELRAQRRTGGGVSISVVDDGPGLAAGMREDAAFAVFATTKAAGTGLGLAIARKIVSQHGGTIQLIVRPGLGTTAEFWISD